MTTKQYRLCVTEAQNYNDRDAYISDVLLSSVFCGTAGDQAPTRMTDAIGSIYDAVHRSVTDIAAAAGTTNRKLAERLCIPVRTVENWSSGARSCPVYVSLLIQQAIGIYDPGSFLDD